VVRIGLALALPLLVAVVVWDLTGPSAIVARFVGSPATRQQVEAAVQTASTTSRPSSWTTASFP
jgi:hypothetical protein